MWNVFDFLTSAASGFVKFFAFAYIAYSLAGRKMPYRKVLALLIPFTLVEICGHFLSLYFYNESTAYLVRMVVCIYLLTLYTLLIFFLFRDVDKKKRFFYASTALPFRFLGDYVWAILYLTIASVVPDKDSALLQTIFNIFTFLLADGIVIIIVRLVSKTKIWRRLQAFSGYPKLFIPMGVIYFLYYVIFAYYGPQMMSVLWYAFCLSIPYLALLAVVVLMVSDIKRTENLDAAQNLLLQQQCYIEEAQKQEGTTVTLLLLQEDGTLTVVVKNPVQNKPDLTQIRNEGYSSKGSGRGIGLFNYQNIIRKYPNATQETKIDGEHFIQVLVLSGN